MLKASEVNSHLEINVLENVFNPVNLNNRKVLSVLKHLPAGEAIFLVFWGCSKKGMPNDHFQSHGGAELILPYLNSPYPNQHNTIQKTYLKIFDIIPQGLRVGPGSATEYWP